MQNPIDVLPNQQIIQMPKRRAIQPQPQQQQANQVEQQNLRNQRNNPVANIERRITRSMARASGNAATSQNMCLSNPPDLPNSFPPSALTSSLNCDSYDFPLKNRIAKSSTYVDLY